VADHAVHEHNRLYREAVDLITPRLRTAECPEPAMDGDTVEELTRAVELLDRVVELNPGNASAYWFRGKAQQVLEDPESALKSFVRSYEYRPSAEAASEAGISAMEMGDHALGVGLLRMGLQLRPDDPGLLANLGLALLFDGRPVEARPELLKALSLAPQDRTSRSLLQATDDVLADRRPCPHSLRELALEVMD
jgi:Flp pilus assembly protein TadD